MFQVDHLRVGFDGIPFHTFWQVATCFHGPGVLASRRWYAVMTCQSSGSRQDYLPGWYLAIRRIRWTQGAIENSSKFVETTPKLPLYKPMRFKALSAPEPGSRKCLEEVANNRKNHGYRTCSLISLGCYDVVTRLRCSFGNSGGLWLASLSSAGNTNHLQQTAALGQASIPPGWFFPIKN